jgi:hypothetical protein
MFTSNLHIPILRRVTLVSWYIAGGPDQYAKIYNFETVSLQAQI